MLGGGDRAEACRIFGLGQATLQRWLSQYKKDGNVTPKPMGSRPWKLDHDAIVAAASGSDATLQQIALQFGTVPSGIYYVLRKFGITRKKNHAISRAGRKETC